MARHKARTSGGRLAQEERRMQVIDLRIAGVPRREIARQLGISEKLVWDDMSAVLDEWAIQFAHKAPQVRALETERLDAMLFGIWPKASHGDLAAIDRVLKIQERRARYCGLDVIAPETVVQIDGVDLVRVGGEVVGGAGED